MGAKISGCSRLVEGGKEKVEMNIARTIARVVALIVRDPSRLHWLFDYSPSTEDQPDPPAISPARLESDQLSSERRHQVQISDANVDQLRGEDKGVNSCASCGIS